MGPIETITHTCGHIESHYIGRQVEGTDDAEDYAALLRWLATRPCSTCIVKRGLRPGASTSGPESRGEARPGDRHVPG